MEDVRENMRRRSTRRETRTQGPRLAAGEGQKVQLESILDSGGRGLGTVHSEIPRDKTIQRKKQPSAEATLVKADLP